MLHPTGNRNVRAVIEAFTRAGILAEFGTTVAVNPDSAWLNIFPKEVRRELLRRCFPLESSEIFTSPFLEVARMVLPKIGLHYFVKQESGWASVDSVYRSLDYSFSRRLHHLKDQKNLGAVYAYEDGALASFTKAKTLGLTCIYDLPIAFWETVRQLLSEEAERLPHWAHTLGGGVNDSVEKLERKTRELELADVVIGPGDFVIDSLPKWANGKRVIRSAFGSPPGRDESVLRKSNGKVQGPLRVLFVGSMGQRKGLGDLFYAFKLLKRADIELVVMGSLLAPMEFYKNECPGFIYEQGRPNEEVLALMRSCDVFCLPSIVEGRALVMQEAMSQGLPLIITPNTGGADLIQEGITGFLVPIRSPQLIAEKLTWFLENRSKVDEMGRMAQKHAKEYTWEKYGNNIVSSLICKS